MNNSLYLEHANITVKNLQRSIDFIKTAFPTFKIRGGGNFNGREWVHIGNEEIYLAINQETEAAPNNKNINTAGINHLGFVVENVDEIANRLLEAGFKRDYPKQIEQFRIRDYFVDEDGNEFEFVQYLSDNPAERNKY